MHTKKRKRAETRAAVSMLPTAPRCTTSLVPCEKCLQTNKRYRTGETTRQAIPTKTTSVEHDEIKAGKSLPIEMYALIISYASNNYSQAAKLQLVSKEWRGLVRRFTLSLRFETERYAPVYFIITFGEPLHKINEQEMPNRNEKMLKFAKAILKFNHLTSIDCTDAISVNEGSK